MTAFSTLNVLPPAQLTNLNELGYLTMTPVQAAALPAILAGKDVRVQAKTGSGKTAAFGLGLLQQIDASLFQTQALVLCPTRELADQVAGELRRLARFLPNLRNAWRHPWSRPHNFLKCLRNRVNCWAKAPRARAARSAAGRGLPG